MFEILYESARQGELICVDGGMLRYHRRKDDRLTIHEILLTAIGPERDRRGQGIGTEMLRRMIQKEATAIAVQARVPTDLEAVRWYERRGFVCYDVQPTKSGSRNIATYVLEGAALEQYRA